MLQHFLAGVDLWLRRATARRIAAAELAEARRLAAAELETVKTSAAAELAAVQAQVLSLLWPPALVVIRPLWDVLAIITNQHDHSRELQDSAYSTTCFIVFHHR